MSLATGWGDWLSTAYVALRMHRMRSLLTILGIVIGITTVIALQALVNGLNRTVESQFKSIGADMISVNLYDWGIQFGPRTRKPRKPLTMEDCEAVARCPSVKAAAPTIYDRQQLRYRKKAVGPLTVCGTGEPFPRIENYAVASGRFFTDADVIRARWVAVIGHDVQRDLFGVEDPRGKTIKIASRTYDVIGVLATRGAIFGESQDNLVAIPATTFQNHFGKQRSVNISAQPVSRDRAEVAKEEIRIALRRTRGVRPGEPDDFALNTADQLITQFKQLTGAIFAAMVGIGGLSLLVGGIGIMNIMLVSVTERTREIGIRKALGARRRDIRGQFLAEAVLLCLVGGVAGVTLGLGLAALIGSVSPLDAAVTPGTVVLGLAFSSVVGIGFGLLPAVRAARLNPVDALWYE
ncbi:ABC transporter permease [Candidatus Fermentibacteria bacterium]|nr:ABC transporter permease [Candidatus Fermentibacteria bacterium]